MKISLEIIVYYIRMLWTISDMTLSANSVHAICGLKEKNPQKHSVKHVLAIMYTVQGLTLN